MAMAVTGPAWLPLIGESDRPAQAMTLFVFITRRCVTHLISSPVIQLCSYSVMQLSGHAAVRSCRNPVLQPATGLDIHHAHQLVMILPLSFHVTALDPT